jgi:hypothetical protein
MRRGVSAELGFRAGLWRVLGTWFGGEAAVVGIVISHPMRVCKRWDESDVQWAYLGSVAIYYAAHMLVLLGRETSRAE